MYDGMLMSRYPVIFMEKRQHRETRIATDTGYAGRFGD